MSVATVVGGGEGVAAAAHEAAAHEAAAHAVAAFGQGMTAQQQRELERTIEQSTREQVQRAVEAAQQAAQSARAGQLAQPHPLPPVPPLPPLPEMPTAPVTGIVIGRNGERIVVGDARQPVLTVRGRGDNQDVQFYPPNVPTEYIVLILSLFLTLVLIAIGMPLARAYARRMDRQGGRAEASHFPSDVSDRIERIEQAVEAIAIEVERVSEGQRFTTKLLSELRTPAALAASSSQFTGDKR